MNTDEILTDIIQKLNDNRSKLSALFSLYNSSILSAEDSRMILSSYYEQMIDYKNDLSMISNSIYSAKKDERESLFLKNKSKIKRLNLEVKGLEESFTNSCNSYKIALQSCGSLKTEYKHEVSELCKQFKAGLSEETSPYLIKGYKQQIRIIKAILDRIEQVISDYNIKRNKVEEDNSRFDELYQSVNLMLDKLKTIA